MNILLDTNIYLQDLLLQKPDFEVMKSYLRKTKSSLLFPEIVTKEIDKHIARKAADDFRLVKGSYASKMSLLDPSLSGQKIEEQLKENFKNRMLRVPQKVLKNADITLEDLITRSLGEKPPFQKSDKGLRDTVIWLSLIQFLRTNPSESVAFITLNSVDFGTDKLSDELLNELLEANLTERVFYFNSLGDFLSIYEKPISYIDDEFITKAVESYVDDYASDLDEDELDIDLNYHYRELNHEIDYIEYDGFDLDGYYVYSSNEKEYVIYVDVIANYAVSVTYDDIAYRSNHVLGNYDYERIHEKEYSSAFKSLDFFVHVDKASKQVTRVEG